MEETEEVENSSWWIEEETDYLVAQSEQCQIPFGHLLKTVWTVSKNQIWEGI